ncbi:MAG TPA: hypothetical protein VK176_09725 [Phycisphaerales bacterium]|nr:hypothetical protein [Phycisphaerales bacterium]
MTEFSPHLTRAAWWLAMGESSLAAAATLKNQHPRSAVSRYYYSVFCAAHAAVICRGQTLPRNDAGEEINWSHVAIRGLVETNLKTRHPQYSEGVARAYRLNLESVFNFRLRADYAAQPYTVEVDVREAEKIAVPFMRLAKEIVHGVGPANT